MINFKALQNVFNERMDSLLSSSGLTTKCRLNFGVTNKEICPNCIFDPILQKSANKYKSGGPINFSTGMLCPYCNGIGYYGTESSEEIFMAIISNNKDWINPPTNIAIANDMIQSLCLITYLNSIKQCKSMSVIFDKTLENRSYALYADPTLVGLGDNNYVLSIWRNQ